MHWLWEGILRNGRLSLSSREEPCSPPSPSPQRPVRDHAPGRPAAQAVLGMRPPWFLLHAARLLSDRVPPTSVILLSGHVLVPKTCGDISPYSTLDTFNMLSFEYYLLVSELKINV